jgi:hypothetical protein
MFIKQLWEEKAAFMKNDIILRLKTSLMSFGIFLFRDSRFERFCDGSVFWQDKCHHINSLFFCAFSPDKYAR